MTMRMSEVEEALHLVEQLKAVRAMRSALKPGSKRSAVLDVPAVHVDPVGLDADIVVTALNAQEALLVTALGTLGITES